MSKKPNQPAGDQENSQTNYELEQIEEWYSKMQTSKWARKDDDAHKKQNAGYISDYNQD